MAARALVIFFPALRLISFPCLPPLRLQLRAVVIAIRSNLSHYLDAHAAGRSFDDTSRTLQEHRRGRGFGDKSKGTISIHGYNHRNDQPSHLFVRRLGVELLAKLHDIDLRLAQSRTNRGSRSGFSSLDLQLYL